MKQLSKHWVLVGCVVALAFAGCKSGDDDDDNTTGAGGMPGGTGGMMATGGTSGGGTGGMAGSGTGGMMGSGGMMAATGGTSGGGTGGMTAGGTGGMDSGPTFEPKFSAIFKEIIKQTGCNGGTLCHGGTVGMLTMTAPEDTYKALVGVDAMGTNLPPGGMDCKDSGLKRVVAGDPDKSLLYLKITSMQPCGNKMPPNGASLADKQIMQIKTWIMNGAMDD